MTIFVKTKTKNGKPTELKKHGVTFHCNLNVVYWVVLNLKTIKLNNDGNKNFVAYKHRKKST